MDPISKTVLFIAIVALIGLLLDLISKCIGDKGKGEYSLLLDLISKHREDQGNDEYSGQTTTPYRTGQYRLEQVEYNGQRYMCLQTQWSYFKIDKKMNGERVVYWKWSTYSEIKDWHQTKHGK